MKRGCDRWLLAAALVAVLAVPVLAIDGLVRVSQFGGGVQIWFEAEDYDERDPDDDSHYQVVPAAGAFGEQAEAINRIAGGGRLRYDFNIDEAEGVAGTWHMWGRVINPANQSDYMLVEDDIDDADIPDFPPYPAGDGMAPFDNTDDRIFEGNVGPDWGWFGGSVEGHTKELRDGANSMFLFHRQGNNTVLWDVFMWTDDPAYTPTDEDYQNADILGDLPCDEADTHCAGLAVDGPAGDTAGTYNVTVTATDDNDDEILYTLTANNGVDPPETITSIGDNVLSIFLAEGTWTITVTVDDHRLCDDAAADNTCSEGPFEVKPVEGRGSDKPFRISDYAGGVQIWFEAEDFTERIPDDETFFPIVPGSGALNGLVLSRAGGAGGCVRWDFDISEAQGVGGDWTMWTRLVNPSNLSDYMLIEGDPGDLDIPDVEPYPGGDGAAPFDNADDRVFEATTLQWGWATSAEGHTKSLHDGLNSMFLFHRQGDASREIDVILWSDNPGYVPTDEDYLGAVVVNPPPCEDPGDTACLQIDVDGPAVNGNFVAGFYTVTVEAEDDGQDLILYTLTADNGVDPPIVARTAGDGVLPVDLTVLLQPGTWTLSVTVDDDILCDDADAENTCTHGPFEVRPQEIDQPDFPETPFKISNFGAGVQVWFEAEDYTERIPDDDTYFPVVFAPGAYGDDELAVSRGGGAGGCMRWDFDIEEAGGFAGEWRMWGRVINPSNLSDYLIVLGDQQDFEIPNVEPYPGGDSVPPFTNGDDQVFEGTVGPDWGWFGNGTGHTKDLLDGVNSMYMFHRQGDPTRLLDVIVWTNDPGYVPTDEDYEMAELFEGGGPARPTFHRGDPNDDGAINITDPIGILEFLFAGGGQPPGCLETADVNNDGAVNITDPVGLLGFLFGGEGVVAPPGPVSEPCGPDPDAPNTAGDLGCGSYTNC